MASTQIINTQVQVHPNRVIPVLDHLQYCKDDFDTKIDETNTIINLDYCKELASLVFVKEGVSEFNPTSKLYTDKEVPLIDVLKNKFQDMNFLADKTPNLSKKQPSDKLIHAINLQKSFLHRILKEENVQCLIQKYKGNTAKWGASE